MGYVLRPNWGLVYPHRQLPETDEAFNDEQDTRCHVCREEKGKEIKCTDHKDFAIRNRPPLGKLTNIVYLNRQGTRPHPPQGLFHIAGIIFIPGGGMYTAT